MISFSKALDEYLRLRRGLGFRLREEESALTGFIAFLNEQHASFITVDLAVRWATKPKDVPPSRWAKRLIMVRRFAHYLSASEPRHEVPSRDLLPYRYHRKPPHIYTDEEALRLIQAAKRLPSRSPAPQGLRARTYATLFGLLEVTGMRIGEALGLDRKDIDWTEGVLTIRGTKFHKSRLVPVHQSTKDALRAYVRFCDRVFPHAKTPAFFISEGGKRLLYEGVSKTFLLLSREIGFRSPSARHGPRLHDFRHRFAVQTLLRWYRQGVDVEQHMPELSTYLGHGVITDTYWYLSATPELLQLAAMRLDHK